MAMQYRRRASNERNRELGNAAPRKANPDLLRSWARGRKAQAEIADAPPSPRAPDAKKPPRTKRAKPGKRKGRR